MTIVRTLALFAFLSALSGCTTQIVRVEPTCVGIDWWEVGRTDGVAGLPATKVNEYRSKCDVTANPVNIDLYNNGREAGLVDYCTHAQGFAAGRTAQSYEKVCPENLEKSFLDGFKTGSRVRTLESENDELRSRIENLTRLLSGGISGSAVKAQIDQLKDRRAKIETEITVMESNSREM